MCKQKENLTKIYSLLKSQFSPFSFQNRFWIKYMSILSGQDNFFYFAWHWSRKSCCYSWKETAEYFGNQFFCVLRMDMTSEKTLYKRIMLRKGLLCDVICIVDGCCIGKWHMNGVWGLFKDEKKFYRKKIKIFIPKISA